MGSKLVLTCDMSRECQAPVTHIDEKGFIYCREHGHQRREYGKRCRQLAQWEVKRLLTGKPLARYEPGPQPTEAGRG